MCGGDTWCTKSDDGAVARCMRVESDRPSNGSDGLVAWIHTLATNGEQPHKKHRAVAEKKKPQVDFHELADKLAKSSGAARGRSRLSKMLGVSVESLERLHVGVGWDSYRGEEYTSWPERNGDGVVTNIVRRYWGSTGKKSMFGGAPGIYFCDDCAIMPGPVFLVEGGSDTAACRTIGVSAIGRPSNLGGIDLLASVILRETKADRRVIVVGERDEKPEKRGTKPHCLSDCQGCLWCWPGRAGAIISAARLSSAIKRKVGWAIVPNAKDAREWIRANTAATPIDFISAIVDSASDVDQQTIKKYSGHSDRQ